MSMAWLCDLGQVPQFSELHFPRLLNWIGVLFLKSYLLTFIKSFCTL